jgi:hypothetical protein
MVDENGVGGDSRVESLSLDDGSADADFRELRKAALEAAVTAKSS